MRLKLQMSFIVDSNYCGSPYREAHCVNLNKLLRTVLLFSWKNCYFRFVLEEYIGSCHCELVLTWQHIKPIMKLFYVMYDDFFSLKGITLWSKDLIFFHLSFCETFPMAVRTHTILILWVFIFIDVIIATRRYGHSLHRLSSREEVSLWPSDHWSHFLHLYCPKKVGMWYWMVPKVLMEWSSFIFKLTDPWRCRQYIPRNAGNHSPNNTVSHPSRPESSETLQWKPQISWDTFVSLQLSHKPDKNEWEWAFNSLYVSRLDLAC